MFSLPDITRDLEMLPQSGAPSLDFSDLSQDDRVRALSLVQYLDELYKHSRSYGDALLLAKWTETNTSAAVSMGSGVLYEMVWGGWMEIAYTSAVLSARNYWKALEAIGALAGSISLWKEKIDFPLLKAVRVEFSERFPKVDMVRHSVAHPEYYANPDKRMAPEDKDHYLRSSHGLGNYTATFEGKTVSCEVTRDAAKFIALSTLKTFEAFAPLQFRIATAQPRG